MIQVLSTKLSKVLPESVSRILSQTSSYGYSSVDRMFAYSLRVSVAALETMTESIDPGYSPLSEAKAQP